jgi:S1-C subfamily serine protease
MTKGVELIANVKPAVAAIFAPGKDGGGSTGTGTVIHPAGYILTANHVVTGEEGFAVFGLTREKYRVVGRLPEKDLAILKVESPRPRKFVPLGRSNDAMDGEPIVVIGNPGGRGLVYSQGIVSAASIDPSWPSLLAKTFWRSESTKGEEAPSDGRDDFIQFDAASNRGNSGGPLINNAGDLIGVVSRKSFEEQGINWAIPVDRVRRYFDYLVQPEEQEGFWLGLEIDPFYRGAVVKTVAADSPAAKAGIAVGDVISQLDHQPVGSASDWLLLLAGHKPGSSVKLQVTRNDSKQELEIPLAAYPTADPIPKDGKVKGLRFEVFRPAASKEFKQIPDFASLKPVQTGEVASLSPDAFVEGDKDNYAVVFQGYVDFPAAGQYRLSISSDDGTKLFLNHRLVVDNDFAHPESQLSRMVRVGAGLNPIRIEYFSNRGGRALKMQMQKAGSPDEPAAEVPFYRD